MAITKTMRVAGDPLVVECNRRIKLAEADRSRHRLRMDDCNKLAMPWRHRIDTNAPDPAALDEVFDSTPMMVVQDFAADMLNTFTPRKNAWLEAKPVKTYDKGDQRQLLDGLKKVQDCIFDEMARSNLYQALPESYLDLSIGTMALSITDIGISDPLHCQAITAPTDLLIDRGPYGYVDGKWRKWRLTREAIKVHWPEAKLPEQGGRNPDDGRLYDITDGCWRDWNDRGTERHKYVVLCHEELLYQETYSGRGSCPFIVARWLRDSTTAWGVGPLYLSSPDCKTANHFAFTMLKIFDKYVDPVTSYEDDGVSNVDNGVIPGTWLSRARGSEPPQVVEAKGNIDFGAMQIDELRHAIKRAHYQDRPEQAGKTPPTGQQWADESVERARRMGAAAPNLVQELQYPIFWRFHYLLNKRGVLPKIELNGQAVDIQPVSPLLRAQEQEEVIRLDRFSEMIAARFGPQIAAVVIDIVKYSSKLAELLGVDAKLLRNESDIANAIKQLMPVLQGMAAQQQQPLAGPGTTPATATPGTI